MKDVLVSVDKAGRVTLPKNVREKLALNAGDLLKISVHGDEVMLRPHRTARRFLKRGGALVFSVGESELLKCATVNAICRKERARATADVSGALIKPKLK